MRTHTPIALILGAALSLGQASALAEARCADFQTERRAFFGELHVHTAISMDANMFGTRLRPDDAYRFARGERVYLVPAQGEQPAKHPVQIDRPLDFAAVTDHAMNFGFVRLCTTPGSGSYETETCRAYRAPLVVADTGNIREVVGRMAERLGSDLTARKICGADGEICRTAAYDVWEETQRAAARFDDDSEACAFTTFVAYEYTATPELTKIHRNVIFRNEHVPELPISYADEPEAIDLWRRLRAECIESGTGCDVLAIPHNSNLSNGHMFQVEYGEAESPEAQAEVARLRASMEPLVEVMQMKGDSECRNGLWKVLGADEFCNFEKMRSPDSVDCQDGTGRGALAGDGCVSRLDYARYALVEGLREADRIGVNPYAFGLVAATDGHEALPGAVEESRLDLRLHRPTASPGMNPGGLAGIWAEENSREALFLAMRRRETFGTSGPRLQLRFFGGWEYPSDLCEQADWVAQGYAGGVPMGGDLPPRPPAQTSGPRFAVSALRDPGTPAQPGNLLQRIQIVKGWAGAEGRYHQQVVDVAGGDNEAGVDVASCTPRGPGTASLCGVWTDPDFDPAQRAVYYARAIENPSCRSTGWACAQAPEGEKPDYCGAAGVAFTTQERGWTSPIWYAPGG